MPKIDNETDLRLYEAKREYIFRDIQILYDLSTKVSVDKNQLGAFKSRYKRIDKLRDEFVNVTSEINTLKLVVNPQCSIDMNQVKAFDDMYYVITEVAESIFARAEATPPAAAVGHNAGSTSADYLQNNSKPYSQARLPTIELVKFDGNIEQWQTFYDTFESLVHSNNNISNIEKFHYLLSCLGGSALSIAKGIPVTADNYQIVYETLIDRYQNKRILAVNYLEKICNYSTLKTGQLNDLRNLTSLLQESVNALRSVNIENLGEFILFYLSSRKLDADTRKRFELQNSKQIPTFSDLLTFLQGYIKVLEASEPNLGLGFPSKAQPLLRKNNYINHNKSSSSFPVYYNNTEPHSVGEAGPYLEQEPATNNSYSHESYSYAQATPSKYVSCVCCGDSHHAIYKCPVFHAKTFNEREYFTKLHKLCYNCLRPHHTIEKCFSKTSCIRCNGRHHTLLHREPSTTATGTGVAFGTPEVPVGAADPGINLNSINTSTHFEHGRSLVLLGTCVVKARGAHGLHNVRALIDSGAQDCFVTSACAQRLGLPLRRCNITVAGLGQNTVHEIKGMTSFTIQPQHMDMPTFKIQAIVMKTISHKMPSVEIPLTIKNKFKHLVLADNNFDQPLDIDLLIGAELFHHIYDGQRMDVGPDLPVALHSIFGWVITGKINPECRPPANSASLLASTFALDNCLVKQFWEVEEPPKLYIKNPEHEKCEKLYTELVCRREDGRYVVPMLVKEDHENLGDSFHGSLSRLCNLEKRFLHNESLRADYTQFMKEYEELGHMRAVSPSDTDFRYIIPHHCVLRPESVSTKLRVVFDASAHTTTGLSLNNIVYTGPKLQNDIVDIITKFRLHKIVFTADISKMYRNINLRPEDRKYQHVLWRNSPSERVREYELETVTYGVSSSPFLAIRTLHQLAKDHGEEWPQAASILLHDTFMDDITAGAQSLEEAFNLKNQLINLLNCGKFELRKWSSNSSEFLAQLPSEHCQSPKAFCEDNHQLTLKVLGIQWDPTEDVFTYSQSKLNTNCTKRAILSNIARIYDPLGWLTPMVLKAKLLIQELWRLNLKWDDVVPTDVAKQWAAFVADFGNLSGIRIPRFIIPTDSSAYELVGFCDGSSKGYGCCVYLRAISKDNVTVNLLIAKSRVAPIKPLTINRLELLGAVLLARVLKHMAELLSPNLPQLKVTAFTDSNTVLAWLNTEPYKLKTFVSHRVVLIADLVHPKNWYHVPTQENPADHCSRGLTCTQLNSTPTWWGGPSWLSSDILNWPTQTETLECEHLPEFKTHLSLISESLPTEEDSITKLLQNFSSFSKVKRILAWCLRFAPASKKLSNHSNGLSTDELEASESRLIRHEQIKFFADELKHIERKESCSRQVQKLNPFIDQLGHLRVGGRLQNSSLPLATIYPFILPKSSRLSTLIIDYYHRLYLHCGPRTLQSLIQRKFWILGVRNLIRSRLSKCVICFKANPTPLSPLMGNLPAPRVQPSRCFQNIGVDFAGPFTIKETKRRKASTYRVYICVFVCLAVKAIHLELVTDLSTPAFIAALDRFVSRRGLCKLIISDCGTNFVGAKRYLNEVQLFLSTSRSDLDIELSKRDIRWQHNPPTASHFGGIFESGVKSMKYHLKRVIGVQILTFEEFLTVLNKVEAILNSRPLCALSNDPMEVDVLTAGHFIVGGPLVSLPEPPLSETYISPRQRWQMLQQITQSFWKIWQSDYLHTLQQRSKWFKGQANVKLGDLVTLVEQNLSPLEWRFGRVTELHPGSDGVVRVVTIRTSRGLFRRPVAKICPLPINN